MKKVHIFPIIRRIFNEKNVYLVNFFEPELLKHKTNFIVTNVTLSNMMNLWAKHYYSIRKLKICVKNLPELSLSA